MKFETKKTESAHRAFKLLSHKSIQKILNTLEKKPLNVTQLYKAVGLEQSATSQFLGKLRKYGFVTFKKDSKVVTYSINAEQVSKFIKAAEGLFN